MGFLCIGGSNVRISACRFLITRFLYAGFYCSSFDAPSRPLIQELGWKTIEDLINCETKTMVYKSLHQLAPEYLCSLFTRNSQCASHSLRNTETDARLPKNTANGQKCFSYRGAKLWNSLSAKSKQASSLNSFKRSI